MTRNKQTIQSYRTVSIGKSLFGKDMRKFITCIVLGLSLLGSQNASAYAQREMRVAPDANHSYLRFAVSVNCALDYFDCAIGVQPGGEVVSALPTACLGNHRFEIVEAAACRDLGRVENRCHAGSVAGLRSAAEQVGVRSLRGRVAFDLDRVVGNLSCLSQ